MLQELLKTEISRMRAAQATKSVHWMDHLKDFAGAGIIAAFNPYAAGIFLVAKQVANKYL